MPQMENYRSYPDMFSALAQKYGGLPIDNVLDAFARTQEENVIFTENPYIQNRRIKNISSLPVQYEYSEVAEMVQKPDANEKPLRQVSHVLESTASPYFKIRKTTQDILTYHWYTFPAWTEDGDGEKEEMWREARLVQKIADAAAIKQTAHMIVGQCVEEGKVFYTFRHDIDKAHNQVNYAFMQQLPQDWVKIVGYNNVSKYTVAINLMYFMQPGASPWQYGDLLEPYMPLFTEIAPDLPRKRDKKFVYASGYERYTKLKANGMLGAGNPDVYFQGGRWFYWVTLPIDRVWTFEADDVNRNVVPPYTGLFLAMANIAKYEQVQLSLVQNPLVSIVLGEIPYRDNANATTEDSYKLSPTGRRLFEAYWYNMLAANNTSGVGLYTGPFERLHLEQLAEAPSATEISSAGYSYAMQKSGIGIIPSTDDPRAGTIQVSLQIECRFGEPVYRQIERMMNYIYSTLNLKWTWQFRMFGSIATDKDDIEECRAGMTLGILPATMKYLALHDMHLTDDVSMSRMVKGSGVLDLRIPLVSSYSAKQEKSGLPPQSEGGRPRSKEITSEGQEQDFDNAQ